MKLPIALPSEPTLGWLTASRCTGSWVETYTPVLAFWSAPPTGDNAPTSVQRNGDSCGVAPDWVIGFTPAIAVPVGDVSVLTRPSHPMPSMLTQENS